MPEQRMSPPALRQLRGELAGTLPRRMTTLRNGRSVITNVKPGDYVTVEARPARPIARRPAVRETQPAPAAVPTVLPSDAWKELDGIARRNSRGSSPTSYALALDAAAAAFPHLADAAVKGGFMQTPGTWTKRVARIGTNPRGDASLPPPTAKANFAPTGTAR